MNCSTGTAHPSLLVGAADDFVRRKRFVRGGGNRCPLCPRGSEREGAALGRVQIDTADELLATELMLNGVFTSLDKHQLVALVSCLVPSDKSEVTR